MRSNKPNQPNNLSYDVLHGLFEAEHRPNHDTKWKELSTDQPELATSALIRADQIESEDVSPRDAYLQGVADAAAVQRRIDLLASFRLPDHLPLTVDDDKA